MKLKNLLNIIAGIIIIGIIAYVAYAVWAIKHVSDVSDAPPAQNQTAATTPATATPTSLSLPIKYNNSQYGFTFSLPADWQGYTVFTKQWTGYPLTTSGIAQTISGSEIYIRNPNWTAQNPYEDIPVMVFTLDEWSQVQQEKISVSAAPFGPSELGHNQQYVFALPPRYDYDYRTGYQEVEKIMQSNPLQGWTHYTSSRLGFSIDYPSDLTPLDGKPQGEPDVVSFLNSQSTSTEAYAYVQVNIDKTSSTDPTQEIDQSNSYKMTTLSGFPATEQYEGTAVCPECDVRFIMISKGYRYMINIQQASLNLPDGLSQTNIDYIRQSFKIN